MAVAITSIRLSTPWVPTTWAPQDGPVGGIEDELGGHAHRTRVVGGVVEGVGVHHPEGAAVGGEALLVPADRAGGQIEHLDDGRSQRGDRMAGSPGDVVCHPAALAVGDVGQGNQ
jgi:hypothetical protein